MFDLSKFMIGAGSESEKSNLEKLPAPGQHEEEKTDPGEDIEEEEEKDKTELVEDIKKEEEEEVDSPLWSDDDLQSWPGGDLQVPNSNQLPLAEDHQVNSNQLPLAKDHQVQNTTEKIPVCPTESDSEYEAEPRMERERNSNHDRISGHFNRDTRTEDSWSERVFSRAEIPTSSPRVGPTSPGLRDV